MSYIKIEKGLSNETITKLYLYHQQEKQRRAEELISKNPKLYGLCYDYVQFIKLDILEQMKNKIVPSVKSVLVGC